VVGPQTELVMNEGRATWNQSILLVMERHGYTEEAYFTFSYSHVPNDTGSVGGVFCAVTEDTERVLGERRLRMLHDLGKRSLAEAKTAELACQAAAATLAENPHDIPFALIYLLDKDGKQARLCESVNLLAGTPASPATVSIQGPDDVWGFGRVLETHESHIVENFEDQFGSLPAGPWTDVRMKQALVVPLSKAGGQELPAGVLVAGISPRLAFGNDYRGFLGLAAGQVAAAIANARAYEEERARAQALEELDRAKTIFFSNVSHEFRTPLTLMLGPVEELLARADGWSTDIREQLTITHRNSLRLLKLVNTLLDFSRIEAGRIRAFFEPTDLASFTAELASAFQSATEQAGLRLIVDCPALTEPVYVDRGMWEKIVLNLISNAFKFTFAGDIIVSLRRIGFMVELRVIDTGEGIPDKDIPHLFERFYRVEQARSRTHEGSGIGLALVHELIKLHGGSVRAESRIGQGSTFIVTVPFRTAHLPSDRIGTDRLDTASTIGTTPFVEEALRWLPDIRATEESETENEAWESVHSTAHTPDPSAESQAKPRVLVADDNADMREYIRRLLAQHYHVDTVADGEAALEYIRAAPPDLVVSDVMMPCLNGFGLLKELRADPALNTIPVVLLSARAGEESRLEGLHRGADDYLIKPFSARELLARVDAHISIARLRRTAELDLRASEARFRALADSAPAMLWMSQPDGSCSFRSRGWQIFTGQAESAGLGLGWLDAVHPDDRDTLLRAFRNANEQHAPFHAEYRLRHRDRGPRWVIDDAAPRFDAAGQFLGYTGSVMDISERKEA
jgi:PAS domain S-box-containing protein